jgi:hypothetical protein
MAKANKIAVKAKKKTIKSARRGTNMMPLMPTKGLTWNKAKYYTHYEVESREWLTTVKAYIKKNYDKKTVSAINKLPDWKVGGKSHWACTAYLLETQPSLVPVVYKESMKKWILELVDEGVTIVEEKKVEEKSKKNVHVPTIQERISEQSQTACEEIEEWLEKLITDEKNFDPSGFNFVGHFAEKNVSQAHARKIKKYYAGELDEAQAVQSIPTPGEIKKIKDEHEADYALQMREAYGNLDKKKAKKWLQAIESIMSACDMIIDSAKANRKPRAVKSVSKEKMIAKLQYKESDDKYKIVSVNPAEIIDASEVWVFNTKTRKLGKYVAEEHTTIQVKGTTLLFFDQKLSVQKTLRKPEEQLKEFKKAGKVVLRKFIDNINAVDIKLNGRLNKDTIILKTLK